ncbi:MAG TPA: AprI/Inh family metalloprotease inhibitor [Pseudolabrys sp.]|nr:AprI/Inh family metalloprotease inhibitor [Pseudolabrys sp.]
MKRLLLIGYFAIGFAVHASAQTPPTLGDSAKAVLGIWEFSNAERDKICTVDLKKDRVAVGFKATFDANCGNLFPLVNDVAGWIFEDNDLLRLVDADGKSLVEFSEVEDGIYEAPTPGVGVLFLQNPASAAPAPAQKPEDIAGDWTLTRGGSPFCALTLAPAPLNDGFTLTVKPGCAESIVRLGFAQWRLDGTELVLVPARGTPWRFEAIDSTTWRRLTESADQITLVRQ